MTVDTKNKITSIAEGNEEDKKAIDYIRENKKYIYLEGKKKDNNDKAYTEEDGIIKNKDNIYIPK